MSRHSKLIHTASLFCCLTTFASLARAQDSAPVDLTPYYRFETRLTGVEPLADGTKGDVLVEYFASSAGQVRGLKVTPVLPQGFNSESRQIGFFATASSCPWTCFQGWCIRFCGGTSTGSVLDEPLLVRVDPVPLSEGGLDFNVAVQNVITTEAINNPIQGFTIQANVPVRGDVEN